MLMTREMEYALRILRALCRGEQLSASTIAQREHMSKAVTLKILKHLHAAGLVSSRRAWRGLSSGASLRDAVSLGPVPRAGGGDFHQPLSAAGLPMRKPHPGGVRTVPRAEPHPGRAGRRAPQNTVERNFPGNIGNSPIKEELSVCCIKPHRSMRRSGPR